jgi:hypothetical protein
MSVHATAALIAHDLEIAFAAQREVENALR